MAGKTEDKLAGAIASKEDIRQAIIAKGVSVPTETPLSQYDTLISTIAGSATNAFLVRFVDYDGRKIEDVYVNPGEDASYPATPAGDAYRVFFGWIGDVTNVTEDRVVMAAYDFGGDTATRLFISANTTTGLTVTYSLNVQSGYAHVDWGDGLSEDTSGTGLKTLTHIYAASGDYMITHTWPSWSTGNYLGGLSTSSPVIKPVNILQKAYIGYPSDLGNFAFYGMLALKAACLSFIDVSAGSFQLQGFTNCTALKALLIPKSFKLNTSNTNSVGTTGIKYLAFEDGFVSSGSLLSGAFQNSYNLEYIRFPDSPTYFCASQFSNNYSLKKVVLKQSTVRLASSVFYACTGLEEVIIPEGMTSLSGDTIFYNCNSIKYLDFPSTLTLAAGANIIDYCYNLRTVIFRSTTPPTVSNPPLSPKDRIPVNLKYYVPDASLAAYKAATNWVAVANSIFPLSDLPTDYKNPVL